MPSDRPAIEVIGIGRREPNAANWLIHDVSFAVNFGDRLGILGPSGSGKTVLLRALAMLDPLDAGAIHWQGFCPSGAMPVPAVPQASDLPAPEARASSRGARSITSGYPFTLKSHQLHSFDRRLAIDLLASLGRGADFLDKSSRDLSGGEAQIVAFVRAVQLEPTVLLLDEPTASLDPATGQALEIVLNRWLTARGGERALVWVSHDREQSLRMTGRTISVHAGRLDGKE